MLFAAWWRNTCEQHESADAFDVDRMQLLDETNAFDCHYRRQFTSPHAL